MAGRRVLHAALVAAFAGLVSGCGAHGSVADGVVSPDGGYFAQSTPLGVTVYEVPTGKVFRRLNGGAASCLKFSAESKYLASGNTTDLTLWDLATGKPLASWEGTNRWSFLMDFSRDGALLAARDDKSLRVWEVATQKQVLAVPMPYEADSLAFSPDGKFVAAGGTESKAEEPRWHEVKIWEVPGGKLHAVLKGPEYCIVKSLAFSPDGKHLATGLSVQRCRLWDLRRGKEVWRRAVGNASHGTLTFSPDGRRLFLGGCQSLAVLDTADGAVVGELEVAGAEITSLATSAEPGRLLVATKHGARSVEWASGEQRVVFPK